MTIHQLARIIESIEARAWEKIWEVIPDDIAKKYGARVERVGGTLLTLMTKSISLSINRITNFGITEKATEKLLDDVLARFRSARVKRFCFYLSPGARPSTIAEWLEQRGF